MSLIKPECYKLFIKRYFLLILVSFLLFDVLSVYKNVKANSPLSTQSLEIYKEYINIYQGDLTDEKTRAIEKIREEADRLFEEQEKVYEDYKNAVISLEEYQLKRSTLNTYGGKLEGINAFLRVYDRAVINEMQIMDPTAWNVLLSEENIDFFAVILVILLVIFLCIYDRETGIDYLKSTTLNGKKRLWRIQIFAIIMLSFMIGIIISVLKYCTADICYGLSGHFFRIQNIEGFQNSTKNLTVFGAFIAESFIKTFGLVYLGILTYIIGILLSSSLYTVFSAFVLVYLPAYIFSEKQILYFLPFPSAWLLPKGWLGGSLKDISSNELSVSVFIVYIAFILAFSLVLLIFANVLRKRRNII